MNKQRREAVQQVCEQLGSLKESIEVLQNEEQEYFDNMPYSFQYAEKGQRAEEVVIAFETAMDLVDEALEALGEAAG